MRFGASLDMYRKVPGDLMEGTLRGESFSILAVLFMALLFLLETRSFLRMENVSELKLLYGKEPVIRVNFNITMMDLRCDWAVVDVVSVLGTEQNVTSHITKWEMSAEGVRKRFAGRSKSQKDIILSDESVESTIEDLHEDGEDAVSLDEEGLAIALEENQFVFVDYYTSWCSHCQTLMPTWEKFAEIMNQVAWDMMDKNYEELDDAHLQDMLFPVLIAKVDCVEHASFCATQGIKAYPTLRLFVDGKKHGGDYHDDRTIEALTTYLATMEKQITKSEDGVGEQAERVARLRVNKPTDHQWRKNRSMKASWREEQHPGCQIAGYVFVNHAPGNFHIMARSLSHDLDARWTNISHIVHSLSFGEPWMLQNVIDDATHYPLALTGKLSPMNGNVYATQELHQAFHHHLKVIHHSFKWRNKKAKILSHYHAPQFSRIYQYLPQSQLSEYHFDAVPEAKFIYDISPVAIDHYQTRSKKWYDYLTSIMAIVGGAFTIFGLLESSVRVVTTKKRL